jgi:hypothetical protein
MFAFLLSFAATSYQITLFTGGLADFGEEANEEGINSGGDIYCDLLCVVVDISVPQIGLFSSMAWLSF